MWIDFCRVYTACFVVLRHTHCCEGTLGYYADLFNYRALIFFFFLASGYFTHTCSTEKQVFNFKRFGQLLRVYLFWALVGFVVIYTTTCAARGGIQLPSFAGFMGGMGLYPCWPHNFPLNVPLWFLKALMLLALFSPLLTRLKTHVLITLCVACMALNDILATVDPWEHTSAFVAEWIPPRTFESVLALAFFCAGILIRRHAGADSLTRFIHKNAWWALIASLAMFPAVRLWGFYPPCRSSALVVLSVMTIMGISVLVEKYLPSVFRQVAQWGTAAFFIYVTHYFILTLYCMLETENAGAAWQNMRAVIMPAATIATSLLFFVLLKRFCPGFMQMFAFVKREKQ